jgi:hypothetical protein
MGGKPGTSDFPEPFHPLQVGEAGEQLTCQLAIPARAGANSLHSFEDPPLPIYRDKFHPLFTENNPSLAHSSS